MDKTHVPHPGARMLILLIRTNQPDFFKSLAAINPKTAKFNPFRELAEETKRANAAHDAKMRAMDRRP